MLSPRAMWPGSKVHQACLPSGSPSSTVSHPDCSWCMQDMPLQTWVEPDVAPQPGGALLACMGMGMDMSTGGLPSRLTRLARVCCSWPCTLREIHSLYRSAGGMSAALTSFMGILGA